LTGANTELTVKTVGNLSAEEFNNIIIRSEGGKNVRLSDIGSAVLGPENIETKSVWVTFNRTSNSSRPGKLFRYFKIIL
jgi:multidrug efflux pump subunit AcrB